MRKDKGLNGDLDRLPMLTWIMFLKFLDDSSGCARTRPHWREAFRPRLSSLSMAGLEPAESQGPPETASTTR